MTEYQTLVRCPNCGTEKEINGTEVRVRCANKEDCGKRYYVKKNIVPNIGTENKMLNIAIERLHPPPEVAKGDMDLDFSAIANSSDFQRFIVFLAKKITPGLFKGVNTRVTGEVMKQQFNSKRGDYKLVMKELKEKLKERREKE